MKCLRYSGLLLFGLTACLSAIGQVPDQSSTPNYILRNQDFQDRRLSKTNQNFGSMYYQAHQEVGQIQRHGKAEKHWTPLGPFGKEYLAGIGRVNSVQFHPTDTNTWFICVAQGGLWKTTNAGASWTSLNGDLPILRTSYVAVDPTDANIMYLALGDFAYLGHNLQANENKRNSHYGMGVYKTTDGGQHWKPTGLSFKQTDFEGSLIAKILIHPADSKTVIAVGQTGAYVSKNAGETWSQTSSKLFWDLEQDPNQDSVLFASTGYVHAYQYGEVSILKSTDFGTSWKEAKTPLPRTGKVQRVELAVAPSDNSYVYALACDIAGGFYGFYRSTDGGLNFSTRAESSTYAYNILNWQLDNSPGGQGRYDLAICVDRNDKNKVLTGGVNIWQTTDGGLNFKPVTYWALKYQRLSLHADVHEIVQHPTNNTIFACHDGGLSRSFNVVADNISTLKDDRNPSTSWTEYTQGLNVTSFYRLSVNQENGSELMAGAQDNSTVYTADTAFFNVTGGDGMESVFDDKNFYRYTSAQNGTIWAFFTNNGSFDFDGTIQPPQDEFGEWTTPFVAANNRLYIGYTNLYTANGGFISDKMSDFPLIQGRDYARPTTALAVEKSNGRQIYLGKRGYASDNISNAIWASSDGGKTWKDVGSDLPDDLYPSYLEMNQSDPKEAWITFSGFDKTNKIFHTVDGGTTWKNITFDLPNFPVHCVTHQNDASGYIYVGTDLGVYYLKKDTTAWTPFSTGLPNVIVSELEVDTTDGMLVAATFGRGLWEVELADYSKVPDVGIFNLTKSSVKVEVRPNPVSKSLYLEVHGIEKGIFNSRIIDITGRTVLSKELTLKTPEAEVEYNVSELLPGEYFLILSDGNSRRVSRFVKH
ncbi:MAG: T9SS type A sorting domain-containing protein [Bacteroidia bacterium]|nr:T9SS type A sorting domain-containing protein [Bacteroidia bacterium]